jgi:hypothetical protein
VGKRLPEVLVEKDRANEVKLQAILAEERRNTKENMHQWFSISCLRIIAAGKVFHSVCNLDSLKYNM